MEKILTFAEFKRELAAQVNKPAELINHILPERSRSTKIIHVQSNSFAMQTGKEADKESTNIYKHSWAEYGKATDWRILQTTEGITATKTEKGTEIFTILFKK